MSRVKAATAATAYLALVYEQHKASLDWNKLIYWLDLTRRSATLVTGQEDATGGKLKADIRLEILKKIQDIFEKVIIHSVLVFPKVEGCPWLAFGNYSSVFGQSRPICFHHAGVLSKEPRLVEYWELFILSYLSSSIMNNTRPAWIGTSWFTDLTLQDGEQPLWQVRKMQLVGSLKLTLD